MYVYSSLNCREGHDYIHVKLYYYVCTYILYVMCQSVPLPYNDLVGDTSCPCFTFVQLKPTLHRSLVGLRMDS